VRQGGRVGARARVACVLPAALLRARTARARARVPVADGKAGAAAHQAIRTAPPVRRTHALSAAMCDAAISSALSHAPPTLRCSRLDGAHPARRRAAGRRGWRAEARLAAGKLAAGAGVDGWAVVVSACSGATSVSAGAAACMRDRTRVGGGGAHSAEGADCRLNAVHLLDPQTSFSPFLD
jgi:hypothetical protein